MFTLFTRVIENAINRGRLSKNEQRGEVRVAEPAVAPKYYPTDSERALLKLFKKVQGKDIQMFAPKDYDRGRAGFASGLMFKTSRYVVEAVMQCSYSRDWNNPFRDSYRVSLRKNGKKTSSGYLADLVGDFAQMVYEMLENKLREYEIKEQKVAYGKAKIEKEKIIKDIIKGGL